ncbi:MAG: hypothetical protein RSC05_13290, partial [Acinetobacter sp.]
MSNYIPPDSHAANLNFKEAIGTIDAHNVVLSFGDAADVNLASIDALIATEFNAEISTDSLIQFGSIDAVMNTSFAAHIGAHSDLNFVLGLNHLSAFSYQKASPALI